VERRRHKLSGPAFFWVDLNSTFVIIYRGPFVSRRLYYIESGGAVMATKTNFILKVQDAKLADVQKALKDANINVVSILEVHKEEA
jgi:hypothetical protein